MISPCASVNSTNTKETELCGQAAATPSKNRLWMTSTSTNINGGTSRSGVRNGGVDPLSERLPTAPACVACDASPTSAIRRLPPPCAPSKAWRPVAKRRAATEADVEKGCWPASRRCWRCPPLPWTPSSAGLTPLPTPVAGPSPQSPPSPSPHPDSFSGCIQHALITGYCFSMLYPEIGPPFPKRRWSALRVFRALYAGLVVSGLSVMAAFSLRREIVSDLPWESSVDMMFFGSATAATLLFLDLGQRWRRLVGSFEVVEHDMSSFGYPRNLRKQMKKLTAAVMIGAAVEHILSVWSGVIYSWPCYEKAGVAGLLKGYTLLKFPMAFEVTAYTPWRAIVVFLLNFIGTFFWNFTHLFIMLMSLPLSQRFKQLNQHLEAVRGEVMNDSFWIRSREMYNQLSVLCRQVDIAIGKLVLLSFASNMYFICQQLLQSFRTLRGGFWYNVYFSYSFGYLLVRTVLVSLFAAAVNDESRHPVTVLFSVPAQGFGGEVERFLSQVTRDHVALTGCRFFSVTRGLILTVAGTIISYEIVLMQLHPVQGNGTTNKVHHIDHCTKFN